MRILDVATALNKSSLAGISAGKAAVSVLFAAIPDGNDALVLDFSKVELVTASAFREAVLPIVSWVINDGQTCLLVNVNTTTKEEACLAAERMGIVLLFGNIKNGDIRDVIAEGNLEEKHATTLRIVLELGEADAKAVKERSGENTVTTVWNNRLVSLNKMGLLRERKVGKTKFYAPMFQGMVYGTGLHQH